MTEKQFEDIKSKITEFNLDVDEYLETTEYIISMFADVIEENEPYATNTIGHFRQVAASFPTDLDALKEF